MMTRIPGRIRVGFIAPAHRTIALTGRDPDALLDAMSRYQPPTVDKVLDRDKT